MTPTIHWNRLEKRISKLWPQSALEQKKHELEQAREVYHLKISAHIRSGGFINRDHDWVFEFIIQQSLIEIEEKIDVINFIKDDSGKPMAGGNVLTETTNEAASKTRTD